MNAFSKFWFNAAKTYKLFLLVRFETVQVFWKGHKNLKNLPLLLSNVKTSGRFIQIFVAFSENLNFKLKLFIFSVWMKIIIMLYAQKD